MGPILLGGGIWRQWRRSGIFIVNFEHYLTPFSSFSIIDFKQVSL